MFTYSEAMKEIRSEAKAKGLTFKRQDAYINEKQAYKFVCRESGEVKGSNYTLWSAYEAMQNDDIGQMVSE